MRGWCGNLPAAKLIKSTEPQDFQGAGFLWTQTSSEMTKTFPELLLGIGQR
jgi:hypothetical protein